MERGRCSMMSGLGGALPDVIVAVNRIIRD